MALSQEDMVQLKAITNGQALIFGIFLKEWLAGDPNEYCHKVISQI